MLLAFLCVALLQALASGEKMLFVVKLKGNSFLRERSINPTLNDERLASVYKENLIKKHDAILSSLGQGNESAKKTYSYANVLNGFSAVLNESQLETLKANSEVEWVAESRLIKPLTTQTPKFLGLTDVSNPIWNKYTGRNVIIGVVDTGVFPESPSFSDSGLSNPPTKFKGVCQRPLQGPSFRCNNKLIGARYFYNGLESRGYRVSSSGDYVSARDTDGHGTHTASTAGGSKVSGIFVNGFTFGTASGMAFSARIVAYKVCWGLGNNNRCDSADVIAALDAGVQDGVDVLSLSLGADTPLPLYKEIEGIAALDVIQAGIPVVYAGGNSGNSNVVNGAPWLLTVAGSSIDRAYFNEILLGNSSKYTGTGSSNGDTLKDKFYPLINAASAAAPGYSVENARLCLKGSLDSDLVSGKIVLCRRGEIPRVDKSANVYLAGGVGMILYNQPGETSLDVDDHSVPSSHVSESTGLAIADYISKTRSPVAKILDAKVDVNLATPPQIASFSSTGPQKYLPHVIKPDITAPGVRIVAAYTNFSSFGNFPRGMYRLVSGTSMATPHVAGVVALIRSAYPTWKPSWIYSAIITTGTTFSNLGGIKDAAGYVASPIQMGGGHIDTQAALDPGLVYNLDAEDYRNFLCTDSGGFYESVGRGCSELLREIDFNFPYLSLPQLSGKVTVTRKLTLVGPPATYRVRIEQPIGARVSVSPTSLRFTRRGQTLSYVITVEPDDTSGDFEAGYDTRFGFIFGTITWVGGSRRVKANVAIGTS